MNGLVAMQAVENTLFSPRPIGIQVLQYLIIGIQSQFTSQFQIIAIPVTAQGRHVMGGQGCHRLLRIMGRRNKTAIPTPLIV